MNEENQNFNQEQEYAELTKDEKLWATFCHLGALLVFLLWGVGHIIGPVVVWLLKRHDSEFVDWHGRESLNFQISVTIYSIICLLLSFVVVGVFLFFALWIFWFIVVIISAIKANNGEKFEYPLCIRFL